MWKWIFCVHISRKAFYVLLHKLNETRFDFHQFNSIFSRCYLPSVLIYGRNIVYLQIGQKIMRMLRQYNLIYLSSRKLIKTKLAWDCWAREREGPFFIHPPDSGDTDESFQRARERSHSSGGGWLTNFEFNEIKLHKRQKRITNWLRQKLFGGGFVSRDETKSEFGKW